jgi:hypothetical protein
VSPDASLSSALHRRRKPWKPAEVQERVEKMAEMLTTARQTIVRLQKSLNELLGIQMHNDQRALIKAARNPAVMERLRTRAELYVHALCNVGMSNPDAIYDTARSIRVSLDRILWKDSLTNKDFDNCAQALERIYNAAAPETPPRGAPSDAATTISEGTNSIDRELGLRELRDA